MLTSLTGRIYDHPPQQNATPLDATGPMTVKRMDNVGIVVADLDAAVTFFTELGLVLEGRGRVDGEWAGRVTGLRGQRVEIAMLKTPDG